MLKNMSLNWRNSEKVSGVLKETETQNVHLKDEILLTKEQHQESGKKYEELELSHKKLQEQITEMDERYGVQIKTLQEALQAQEENDRELTNVKEAFNGLSLEVNSSRKKMDELELELQTSTGESRKFEELHKESGLHAESETKRALEFKRLLELAETSAKEMED
ncbi:hypothetical protein Fot_26160 [Forsythia ovata]|uniref:Uncharacterized protein n=1 Tax=Forsythia ovata TaxID=205694 RepID=A0ABD1UB38_9LAMI